MRVLTLLGGWDGVADADAAAIVDAAWHAAGVDATVLRVPDGGPTSALALDARPREVTDGVACVAHRNALWLLPRGNTWEPGALAHALDALAAGGGASSARVVVALGDAAPAGDPARLWGDIAAEGIGAAAADAARRWAGLDIVALVGSDRTLLGFRGMNYAATERRPGDTQRAAAAQAAEERWTSIAAHADGANTRRTLLGAARASELPGSGAAGGLAYCLAASGARLVPTVQGLADALGLEGSGRDEFGDVSLVVAILPELEPAAADRGLAALASRLAGGRGVPAVSLSSEVAVGRRDLMAAGLAAAHEASAGVDGLAEGVRRVAQTWARAS